MQKCAWHLCNNEVINAGLRGKKYCGRKCLTIVAVTRHRRRLKRRAVAYLGGKCIVCGYDKCQQALQFHHKDPKQKLFSISVLGKTRSWPKVLKEIVKCELLCANCHAEFHADVGL